MAIPILGDVIREVGSTIRELIPDADKRLELDVRLSELADKANERETALLLGQLDVNKTEAAHSNLFVAGWRPFIGWTSGVALGWTWMVAPLLQWGAQLAGIQTTIPALDPNAMYPVILAMLGVGGMRTVEKLQGAATSMGGKILKATPAASQPVDDRRTVSQSIKKTASRWFS